MGRTSKRSAVYARGRGQSKGRGGRSSSTLKNESAQEGDIKLNNQSHHARSPAQSCSSTDQAQAQRDSLEDLAAGNANTICAMPSPDRRRLAALAMNLGGVTSPLALPPFNSPSLYKSRQTAPIVFSNSPAHRCTSPNEQQFSDNNSLGLDNMFRSPLNTPGAWCVDTPASKLANMASLNDLFSPQTERRTRPNEMESAVPQSNHTSFNFGNQHQPPVDDAQLPDGHAEIQHAGEDWTFLNFLSPPNKDNAWKQVQPQVSEPHRSNQGHGCKPASARMLDFSKAEEQSMQLPPVKDVHGLYHQDNAFVMVPASLRAPLGPGQDINAGKHGSPLYNECSQGSQPLERSCSLQESVSRDVPTSTSTPSLARDGGAAPMLTDYLDRDPSEHTSTQQGVRKLSRLIAPQQTMTNPAAAQTAEQTYSRPTPDRRLSVAMPITPDEARSSHRRTCHCKKSQCLKLYCDCFAGGMYCGLSCSCVGCSNREENRNLVLQKRENIKSRDPEAFNRKIQADNRQEQNGEGKHRKGCNCRKSHCLKKYCECFQGGVKCGMTCKCVDCENVEPHEPPPPEAPRGPPCVVKSQPKVNWHIPPNGKDQGAEAAIAGRVTRSSSEAAKLAMPAMPAGGREASAGLQPPCTPRSAPMLAPVPSSTPMASRQSTPNMPPPSSTPRSTPNHFVHRSAALPAVSAAAASPAPAPLARSNGYQSNHAAGSSAPGFPAQAAVSNSMPPPSAPAIPGSVSNGPIATRSNIKPPVSSIFSKSNANSSAKQAMQARMDSAGALRSSACSEWGVEGHGIKAEADAPLIKQEAHDMDPTGARPPCSPMAAPAGSPAADEIPQVCIGSYIHYEDSVTGGRVVEFVAEPGVPQEYIDAAQENLPKPEPHDPVNLQPVATQQILLRLPPATPAAAARPPTPPAPMDPPPQTTPSRQRSNLSTVLSPGVNILARMLKDAMESTAEQQALMGLVNEFHGLDGQPLPRRLSSVTSDILHLGLDPCTIVHDAHFLDPMMEDHHLARINSESVWSLNPTADGFPSHDENQAPMNIASYEVTSPAKDPVSGEVLGMEVEEPPQAAPPSPAFQHRSRTLSSDGCHPTDQTTRSGEAQHAQQAVVHDMRSSIRVQTGDGHPVADHDMRGGLPLLHRHSEGLLRMDSMAVLAEAALLANQAESPEGSGDTGVDEGEGPGSSGHIERRLRPRGANGRVDLTPSGGSKRNTPSKRKLLSGACGMDGEFTSPSMHTRRSSMQTRAQSSPMRTPSPARRASSAFSPGRRAPVAAGCMGLSTPPSRGPTTRSAHMSTPRLREASEYMFRMAAGMAHDDHTPLAGAIPQGLGSHYDVRVFSPKAIKGPLKEATQAAVLSSPSKGSGCTANGGPLSPGALRRSMSAFRPGAAPAKTTTPMRQGGQMTRIGPGSTKIVSPNAEKRAKLT